MKIFALALLAFSLATPSFAEGEKVTVEGSRITPDAAPSAFGGGGVGPRGPAVSRPKRFEGDEAGGSKPLTNAQLAELAIAQIGELVTTLRDIQGYGSLQVIVTTPEGLRVEVNLELGFGKVDVKSRRVLPR